MKKTFKEWIKGFGSRPSSTAYGDLSNDIWDDPNKPNFSSEQEWAEYLTKQGACLDAIETVRAAWKTYISDRKLYQTKNKT